MSTLTAKRGMITHLDPNSQASDAFRTLRNMMGAQDGAWQVLTVVSAAPSEGRTTVAANLALAYAQAGKKVLLVDGCTKQPALDRVFSLSNLRGLTSVLRQTATLGESVQPAAGLPMLSVLTAGPTPSSLADDLLDTAGMEALLKQAKEQFDLILIDSPAMLALADAATLARKSDGVLWVLHAGISRKARALEMKKLLQRLNVRIIGCVLNKSERKMTRAYRHYAATRG